MTRYLKELGLGLVAILAMSAVVTGVARAEKAAILTVEGGGSATIQIQQTGANVLTREGRRGTCEEATLVGTITNGSEEASVTPSYAKCHTIILGTKFPLTITMNGCFYTYELTANVVSESDTFTAISSLICPAGKTVETHVYSNHTNHTNNTSLCTYTMAGSSDEKNQKLKHIDLTNESANAETPNNYLLAHITISSIASASHGSEFTCGKPESTAVEVHGTATAKATKGGAPVGITVSTKP